VNFLSGPGRGVILIKLNFPEDKVIGARLSTGDRDLMTVETSRGAEQTISTAKYEVTGRGGKGRELLQRGQFVRVVPGDVAIQAIPETHGWDRAGARSRPHYFFATPNSESLAATSAPAVDVFTDFSM
jgi:hypothetical protein